MTGIFISYRRDDVPGDARGIHDGLARRFGKANVFMDVDKLLAGQRFDRELDKALVRCGVLIVVIGPRWMELLSARTGAGARDYVQDEIAAALKRGIVVIPVRVGQEGRMPALPRADDLPDDLRDLVLHQKHDIVHETFGRDLADLIAAIRIVQRGEGRPARWKAIAVALVAVSVLVGGGVALFHSVGAWQQAREAAAKNKAEEDTRRDSEAEQRRKSAEAERLRKEAEERQRLAEQEAARKKAEAERIRKETEERQKLAEEEAARKKAEAERIRKEAEERQRLAEERRRKLEAITREPALAVTPGSGQSFRDRLANGEPCSSCPEMVVVPAGAFTMGSPDHEEGRAANEGPQHVITFRPFALGRFEITVDQFTAFVTESKAEVGSNCWSNSTRAGLSFRNPGYPQTGSHPAACLSWLDAQAFVAWLSGRTGRAYRLPTEAQWEYAARGRTTPGAAPRFFFGNDANAMCQHGNAADLSFQWAAPGTDGSSVFPCTDRYRYSAPVGRFSPNPFGLYDVHGNVGEWVEDCWYDNYKVRPPSGGSARVSEGCSFRVIRGGSWFHGPQHVRAASRSFSAAINRIDRIGFRVVRSIGP